MVARNHTRRCAPTHDGHCCVPPSDCDAYDGIGDMRDDSDDCCGYDYYCADDSSYDCYD